MNNNKILNNLQEEYKVLQMRMNNISSGEYAINLSSKIKET